MKLVLAEKPSVAQSIAKVLGAAKREDGHLEGKAACVQGQESEAFHSAAFPGRRI